MVRRPPSALLLLALLGCAPCDESDIRDAQGSATTRTTWATVSNGPAPEPLAAGLLPTLPATPTSTVTPETFGAIADDGQDDGPALQAAFDAAAAQPGSLVRLRVGVYDTWQPVRLGSETTLEGQGPTSVIRGRAPGPAVLTTLDAGAEHVAIRRLRVTGARSPVFNQGGTCVAIHRTHYFLVEQIVVNDCEKYGIWATEVYPTGVVRPTAFGTIRHNTVYDALVGIETTNSHDVLILENTVELTAGHTEAGLHPNDGSRRIRLEANVVEGPSGMGIWVANASDVALVENRVRSCDYALVVGPSVFGWGHSNRIRATREDYWAVDTTAVRLEGCQHCQFEDAAILAGIEIE